MSAAKSAARPASGRNRAPRKPPEAPLGFHWGPVNTVLLAVGLGVLVVGYVLLAKGSLTLAPLLLVSGYCGFIPASLLVRLGEERASGE